MIVCLWGDMPSGHRNLISVRTIVICLNIVRYGKYFHIFHGFCEEQCIYACDLIVGCDDANESALNFSVSSRLSNLVNIVTTVSLRCEVQFPVFMNEVPSCSIIRVGVNNSDFWNSSKNYVFGGSSCVDPLVWYA